MNYSKTDLMNRNNHLLRRTERQLDRVNESLLVPKETVLCSNKLEKRSSVSMDNIVPSIEEQIKKRTRFSLLIGRGGRK
jgi:hypothetical protein